MCTGSFRVGTETTEELDTPREHGAPVPWTNRNILEKFRPLQSPAVLAGQ